MAKEPSRRQGGIFGGKGSLKEDLRDISGDDKITFADTWLGDLLGFDGKAGVQGANLKESWYGARRRPYRERAKQTPPLEKAAKDFIESKMDRDNAQEDLRNSFLRLKNRDSAGGFYDQEARRNALSQITPAEPLTDDDMGLPEGYVSSFAVRPDVTVGRNTKGLMARRKPVDIISVERGYEEYDPEATTLTYKGVDLTNLPDTKEDFLDLIRAGKGKLKELGLFGLTISDYAKAKAAKERILGKTSGTAAAVAKTPTPTTELPKGISQSIDKNIFSKISGKDVEGLEYLTGMTKQNFFQTAGEAGTVSLPENFYYFNTGSSKYFIDTATNNVYDDRLNLLTLPAPRKGSSDDRQKMIRGQNALEKFREAMGMN